jgi:charged multivesicular body protein 7
MEFIYKRGGWSVWNLAGWALKQLGVGDMVRRGGDSLPTGEFVVVGNVEEAGRVFGEKGGAVGESRFERTFSKASFYRAFNDQLVEGRQLSAVDMEVLLKFLARDKGAVVYDGDVVKIKNPGVQEADVITAEDVSIAQLKELLTSLTHQTALLGKRIEELAATAKQAVGKNNRVAALAALKSKKLAESTLERRFATVNQLEEVAAKIEQAADNVQLVKVMESSGEALRSLHAQVGGVERVEEVVDRLREQMAATDEVGSILAESAGTVVVDDAEIDDELAELEGDERRKVEEADKARREAEQAREAEEMRKRLEAIEKVPGVVQPKEQGKEAGAVEDMMSRMTLE